MNGLLDQFECVRLVRMNGIDLNRFQFDYDQTWAVLFFRPDGTLLARYGTRGNSDGMAYNSMDGLRYTMKAALAAHQQWTPVMQDHYKDKIGEPVEFSTAEQIPSSTVNRIRERGKSARQSCIHCHNIYDAQRDVAISRDDYDPTARFKYPLPENIGLRVSEQTEVTAVKDGSPAHQAGIRSKDTIVRMNGQNIHSIADMQFVLHNTPAPGKVAIELLAAGGSDEPRRRTNVTLDLPAGWRKSDISWRASMYGMPPQPGLWVVDLSAGERTKLGISKDQLGLKVRGTFGKEVRQQGLKKGDVIIASDGKTDHNTPGEFHANLRLNHFRPNSKLSLTVLRDGRPKDLEITFANAK